MRACWLVVLAACSSVDPAPNMGGSASANLPAIEEIPRATVERDLVLELKQTSTTSVDHERGPDLEVWIANRSATTSYPVVLANDGSDAGWREPHAFYELEKLGPTGAWEPIEEEMFRCGNYARDWEKDIVLLAPGESKKMRFMPYPLYEIGDATRIRVTARFEYGEHTRDKSKVPPILHSMPAYALKSATLEVPVEHPYGLTLKVKGPLPTKPEQSITSAVDVIADNRSSRPLTFERGQLWLEVKLASQPDEIADRLLLDLPFDEFMAKPTKKTLAVGAHTSVVSPSLKTSTLWNVPTNAPIVAMRAVWRVTEETFESGRAPLERRVESPWVSLP